VFTNEFIEKHCHDCYYDSADCIKDYSREGNYPSCRKAFCIRDYFLDYKLIYKAGCYYPVLETKNKGEMGYTYLVKGNGWQGWFWDSITEYFSFVNVLK